MKIQPTNSQMLAKGVDAKMNLSGEMKVLQIISVGEEVNDNYSESKNFVTYKKGQKVLVDVAVAEGFTLKDVPHYFIDRMDVKAIVS